MRVIGGNLSGRKILEPEDKSTRPLKDMVRESIFNILEHSKNEFIKLNKARVLDLFSGTGSFGIECLSRGAEEVTFFENYSKSVNILKKNINQLSLEKKSTIFEKSAYDLDKINLIKRKFDLIFLDPPFRDNKVSELITNIKKLKLTNDNNLIIIHRNKKYKENISNYINVLREKNYGLSKIIFGKMI